MREGLTYLDEPALLDLANAVQVARRERIPGAIVEAGCGYGGSTIMLAAAKEQSRPLVAFDVFGLIPPPATEDGAAAQERYDCIASGNAAGTGRRGYYGYEPNLEHVVSSHLSSYGFPPPEHHITLIKGLYEDAMAFAEGFTVAVAHIDCDWFVSVTTCLERIVPRLSLGGRLIIDDYDHWEGCRLAVDTYFAERAAAFTFARKARLHIVRNE